MVSKAASVLLILIYPFFFADHECYIISGRDADGSSMDEVKLWLIFKLVFILTFVYYAEGKT